MLFFILLFVSCVADKLDGLRLRKQHQVEPKNLEEFLQLSDDYETRKSDTGKKHVKYPLSTFIFYTLPPYVRWVLQVRWADIEEKKSQERMRDIGFVVGQTDWGKMMDDSHAERALNRTKYI